MEKILVTVLDAERVYDSGADSHSLSAERFYLAGTDAPVWIAVMRGEPLPQRSYNHVAFKIDESDFEKKLVAIRSWASMLDRRVPGSTEKRGRSTFHDEDNHLFELHTGTLVERLAAYRSLQRR